MRVRRLQRGETGSPGMLGCPMTPVFLLNEMRVIAGAGFTYPVQDLYLEDVLRLTGLPAASAKRNAGGSWRKPTDGGNASGGRPKAKVPPLHQKELRSDECMLEIVAHNASALSQARRHLVCISIEMSPNGVLLRQY